METALALLESSGKLFQSEDHKQSVLAHRNIGYPIFCHIRTSTVATLFLFYVSYHRHSGRREIYYVASKMLYEVAVAE